MARSCQRRKSEWSPNAPSPEADRDVPRPSREAGTRTRPRVARRADFGGFRRGQGRAWWKVRGGVARFWAETKGMSNWKFGNVAPYPEPFSSFTPNPLRRGEGTGDRETWWREESRFGEGSEIERAAPGGDLCVIEGPWRSQCKRRRGSEERLGRELLPSPAAPGRWQPRALAGVAALRSRAHHVAGDPALTPRALALGAGAAGPWRRGAVPRRPAARVPRAAQRQEQVSARPLRSPPTQAPRTPRLSSPIGRWVMGSPGRRLLRVAVRPTEGA
jgi:hypothetical protein